MKSRNTRRALKVALIGRGSIAGVIMRSLLERHPELIGQMTLVQIASPTRSALEEYQSFELRVRAMALRGMPLPRAPMSGDALSRCVRWTASMENAGGVSVD